MSRSRSILISVSLVDEGTEEDCCCCCCCCWDGRGLSDEEIDEGIDDVLVGSVNTIRCDGSDGVVPSNSMTVDSSCELCHIPKDVAVTDCY